MRNRERFHREIMPLQRAVARPRGFDAAAGMVPDRASDVRYEFHWSHRRLQYAGVLVALASLAAAPLMLTAASGLRLACVCWFGMLLVAANGLARRINSVEPVITVDVLGVTDRRRSATPLFWPEIGTLARCDVARSQVVEFFLVNPERQSGRSLWDRFGCRLQVAYGLPAVTLSLLLIDASAADIVTAVSTFRPGLVPRGMMAA